MICWFWLFDITSLLLGLGLYCDLLVAVLLFEVMLCLSCGVLIICDFCLIVCVTWIDCFGLFTWVCICCWLLFGLLVYFVWVVCLLVWFAWNEWLHNRLLLFGWWNYLLLEFDCLRLLCLFVLLCCWLYVCCLYLWWCFNSIISFIILRYDFATIIRFVIVLLRFVVGLLWNGFVIFVDWITDVLWLWL